MLNTENDFDKILNLLGPRSKKSVVQTAQSLVAVVKLKTVGEINGKW